MCFSGSSYTNSTGPTLNPHDTTRSAGGSSGGSAVLVKLLQCCSECISFYSRIDTKYWFYFDNFSFVAFAI